MPPRSTLWLGRGAGVSWCCAGGSRGFGRGLGHRTLGAGLPGRAGGDGRRGRRGTHSRAGHLQDPVPQPGDAGVDPRPPSFRAADPPAHDASKEESSRRLLADQRSPRVTLENRGTLSAWMGGGPRESPVHTQARGTAPGLRLCPHGPRTATPALWPAVGTPGRTTVAGLHAEQGQRK